MSRIKTYIAIRHLQPHSLICLLEKAPCPSIGVDVSFLLFFSRFLRCVKRRDTLKTSSSALFRHYSDGRKISKFIHLHNSEKLLENVFRNILTVRGKSVQYSEYSLYNTFILT